MPFQGRDRSIQMYLHNEKVCSNFSQPHMTSTDGNHRMGKKNFKNSLIESTSSDYIYTINTGRILAYTPSWWRSSWWLNGFIILAALNFYVVWLSVRVTPRQSDRQDPRVSETASISMFLSNPFYLSWSGFRPRKRSGCEIHRPGGHACVPSLALMLAVFVCIRYMRRQRCRDELECWARRHRQKQDGLEEVVVSMKLVFGHSFYMDVGVLGWCVTTACCWLPTRWFCLLSIFLLWL